MAQVYQRADRGGAWYMEFRRSGKRYREYAGPPEMKQKDAEEILAKRRIEVRQEEIYGPPPEPHARPAITFAAFADDFLATDSPDKKSKARDKSVIDMLKVAWKGLNLDQVTPKLIADYKAKRLKNREASTVAREMGVIKRMFRMATEWGRLEANPAATIQKPRVNNNRVRHLEADEMARLLKALPEWLRVIAAFALFTGARRGEILNLTWSDVDYKRKMITFRDTKNGEDGHVMMNATARGLLESLPDPIDRSQRVFQLENTPTVWIQIARAWTAACGTAKIAAFHFHDLRHQAATDLLSLGATLNDVRDFLRHKTVAMTLRYAHLVDDRRSSTANLLDRLAETKAATKTATNTGAR